MSKKLIDPATRDSLSLSLSLGRPTSTASTTNTTLKKRAHKLSFNNHNRKQTESGGLTTTPRQNGWSVVCADIIHRASTIFTHTQSSNYPHVAIPLTTYISSYVQHSIKCRFFPLPWGSCKVKKKKNPVSIFGALLLLLLLLLLCFGQTVTTDYDIVCTYFHPIHPSSHLILIK